MPRSYQVTPKHPRPATSDTAKGSQTEAADSLKESQLVAGRGAFSFRRTSPTSRIETAKRNPSARLSADAAFRTSPFDELRRTQAARQLHARFAGASWRQTRFDAGGRQS